MNEKTAKLTQRYAYETQRSVREVRRQWRRKNHKQRAQLRREMQRVVKASD